MWWNSLLIWKRDPAAGEYIPGLSFNATSLVKSSLSYQIHSVFEFLKKEKASWVHQPSQSNAAMVSSCPDPFVDESLFANTGGGENVLQFFSVFHQNWLARLHPDPRIAVSSRWCEDLGGISCCLPCPIGYWRWKDVNCTLKKPYHSICWPTNWLL